METPDVPQNPARPQDMVPTEVEKCTHEAKRSQQGPKYPNVGPPPRRSPSTGLRSPKSPWDPNKNQDTSGHTGQNKNRKKLESKCISDPTKVNNDQTKVNNDQKGAKMKQKTLDDWKFRSKDIRFRENKSEGSKESISKQARKAADKPKRGKNWFRQDIGNKDGRNHKLTEMWKASQASPGRKENDAHKDRMPDETRDKESFNMKESEY